MSAGGLGVLSSHLEVPPVSETSVLSDLLHALDVVSELGVQVVGGDLLELAVLEVSSSVQEPSWEAVGLRVGDNLLDLVDFLLREFSGSAFKPLPTFWSRRSWPSCTTGLRISCQHL